MFELEKKGFKGLLDACTHADSEVLLHYMRKDSVK
jgi:hypothetical protein